MQVGAEHLGMLSKQIYNVLSLYVPDGTVYLTASSAMLIHVSIRSICMFCRSLVIRVDNSFWIFLTKCCLIRSYHSTLQ